MKFSNKQILSLISILLFTAISSYNLDSIVYVYETDTTITKNVFNGANLRCNKESKELNLFYFINTDDNMKTVISFVEKEFSGHIPLQMHKNGILFRFTPDQITSAVEELKEGRVVYTLKVKDIFPHENFPDSTVELHETKEADAESIRNCINTLMSLKTQNTSSNQTVQPKVPAKNENTNSTTLNTSTNNQSETKNNNATNDSKNVSPSTQNNTTNSGDSTQNKNVSTNANTEEKKSTDTAKTNDTSSKSPSEETKPSDTPAKSTNDTNTNTSTNNSPTTSNTNTNTNTNTNNTTNTNTNTETKQQTTEAPKRKKSDKESSEEKTKSKKLKNKTDENKSKNLKTDKDSKDRKDEIDEVEEKKESVKKSNK